MITIYEHYTRPTSHTGAFHYSVLAVEVPAPQPRSAAKHAKPRWEIDFAVADPAPLPIENDEAANEYPTSPPPAPHLGTIELPDVEGHEDVFHYEPLDDIFVAPGFFILPSRVIDGSRPMTPSLVSDNGPSTHEELDDDYTGRYPLSGFSLQGVGIQAPTTVLVSDLKLIPD
jgi:hypothetical protein